MQEQLDNGAGEESEPITSTVTEITQLMQSSITDTSHLLEALLSLQDTHASVQNMAAHVGRIGAQLEELNEVDRVMRGGNFEALRNSVVLAGSLVGSLNESMPQLLELWRLTGRAIALLRHSTSEQATALLREVEFMERNLPGNGMPDDTGNGTAAHG